jgi:hypothetical protein
MAVEAVSIWYGMVYGMLVNQVMSVGGGEALPSTPLIDDGVLAAFGKSKEFQNVLNGDIVGPNPVSNKHGRFWRPKPVQRVTPGDGVLNTVQSVRDQFMKIQNHVETLVNKKQDFSTSDLMALQYEVMQLTYLNELSSKVADKTSQGAQTLFRNQG